MTAASQNDKALPDAGAELPGWPVYSAEETAAVQSVLESGRVNYWTGEHGRRFEQEFAAWHGVRHAIAVSNGSVALGLALRALRLPPGAEVIVTPRTFVASVSEIVLAGGRPVFADVDPDSQNITAASIAAVMTDRTAAILVVHLAGWPCDMPAICALAKQQGIAVIEDCAQAHGAESADRKVGSWGDVAAFSFCQDKIMTTGGEGGMLVTDRDDLQAFCWSFKDHGKNQSLLNASSGHAGFRWVHEQVGTNLRLTEMQAVIGRQQLARLEESVSRRNQNARQLHEALSELSAIRIPWPGESLTHAFYKCYMFVEPEALGTGWTRDRILAELNSAGVQAGSGICPEVYLEQAFDALDVQPESPLHNARRLGETSLMFRVDPALESGHMAWMAERIRSVLERATR